MDGIVNEVLAFWWSTLWGLLAAAVILLLGWLIPWLWKPRVIKDNDHSWMDRPGNRLWLEPVIGRKNRWRVVAGWVTPLGYIHEGFTTDGASIPRILWPFVGSPLDSRFIEAAVLHDWIYAGYRRSRKLADWTFYRLLVYRETGRLRGWLMWGAVRAFGWMFWRRCRRS